MGGRMSGMSPREEKVMLEDGRAERDPAARAVDRGADREHRDEQRERAEDQHRRECLQPAVVPALRDHHQDDPERGEFELSKVTG